MFLLYFSDFKRATYKQVYLAYVGSYYLHHHHHYNQMNLILIKNINYESYIVHIDAVYL